MTLVAAFAASASAAHEVGFFGCRTFTATHPVPVVRPRSIVVACGDGNLYLTAIRWTSWQKSAAAGTGTAHANDCTPNCAAGHFHASRASLALTRPRTCHGAVVFTHLVVTLGGKRESTDFLAGC